MITVGIDIGSLTTKAVVMSDRHVIAYEVILTGDSSYQAAVRAVETAVKRGGIDIEDIDRLVSTGLGKGETPYDHEQATEILCDVKGALFYYPSARTIIDMGAESVRVVRCNDNGRVLDFGLNDKCASGTGIFLDTIAKALEIKVDDLAPLSLQAREDINITATCAVFAESEVVGLIAQGVDKASILGGIHKSIAGRIYGLANRVGINKDVVFIGGGARNIAIVKALEGLLNQGLLISQYPQIVGAVGAAVIAQERSNPQFERAIEDFNEAIRLNPQLADAYNNRGFAYANLGQFRRAIQDYDEAIHLDAKNIKAYYNRGLAYADLGQFKRAIEDFDEVIHLNPQNAWAYARRAFLYTLLNMDTEAQQDVEQAVKLGIAPSLLQAEIEKLKEQRQS